MLYQRASGIHTSRNSNDTGILVHSYSATRARHRIVPYSFVMMDETVAHCQKYTHTQVFAKSSSAVLQPNGQVLLTYNRPPSSLISTAEQ